MALRATNLPAHVGRCRCGKQRGHAGLCNGEQPYVAVVLKPRRTMWHEMRDRLVEQFGEEMGNWLARRIGKLVKPYVEDCMDNFSIVELPTGPQRFSPAAWEAVGRHKEQRESGCCGSRDFELHHYRSGRRFAFGFNHGH